MLCCVEGLGPVRFAGWDDKGHPIPSYPVMPVIRCFATEEGQAGNTFEGVHFMLSELVDDFPGLDVGLTRINLPDGGRIVATTSAAISKDGGRDTFNVFDETHLWTDPRLVRLHATVTRNLMKRKASDGWSLETSTMYAPGEDSVAEQTHLTSLSVDHVLFDHREAPEIDLDDDAAVLEALRYVYGPAAGWMDLEGILRSELRDPQKRRSDFRRYWLNQPSTVEEKFVTAQQWDGCADASRKIPDDAKVIIGFDGSHNNDSTAAVVVWIDPIPHIDVIDLWERTDSENPDWEVDVLDVEEAIKAAGLRWKVIEVAADPYRWAHSLGVIFDHGLPVANFPQVAQRLSAATARFYDLITTQALTHSGDPRLRRHVLNAVLTDDHRGRRITKDSKKSRHKVDACIAAAMAVDRTFQSEDAQREMARQRRRVDAA